MTNLEKLKYDINMAISWGSPDRDSIGYSHDEFIQLLSRALNKINWLEKFAPKEESYKDL
jgi:hypothetical protein